MPNKDVKEVCPPSQSIIESARRGHVEQVRSLIPLSIDKEKNSLALRAAAKNGHVECVKLLIPVSNPNPLLALSESIRGGYTSVVEVLIPVTDTWSTRLDFMSEAVMAGSSECLRLLLPVSDRDDVSTQLVLAASRGHVECVQMLRPYAKEKDATVALVASSRFGFDDCAVVLFSKADVDAAIAEIKIAGRLDDAERVASVYQKFLLENRMGKRSPNKVRELGL